MNPHRTRIAVAAVAITTSTILAAGCSGGSESASSLDPGDVPDKDATLTVWSFLPENYEHGEEAYDKVVAGFEKEYPQVDVDLVEMPYPSYFDQVRNATVSRTGPDVVTMYGGAQAYSYRNALYPLQDTIDPELADDLKYIDANYSKDGNLYIVPTGAYGYAVLQNRSIFAKAGVDPDTALADWDSLLKTCRTFEQKGIQPIASGWKDGFLLETLMYMISSQLMDDATLEKWTSGELPITDPLFAKTIDYVLEMDDAGCFGGDDALGRSMWNDSFNQYYAGDAAMLIMGSLSTAEQGHDSVPSTTVTGLPQVPDSEHEALIDAGAEAGWSVTKWTEHPEAAAAFVNYMARPEAQAILWNVANVPPNVAGVELDATTPIQKDYLPLLDNPENHTGFAAFPLTVLATVERNASSLIDGSMSEQEFFDQANTAFEQSN